jgi:molybdate transport system regulatory protein
VNLGRGASAMDIKYKLWLEKNGAVIFGQGRDDLLRAIDRHKSLYGAAKDLKMSYRAAWGKLRKTEARLGIKLVEIQEEGKGMQLTADARELLDRFEQLENDFRQFLRDRESHFKLPESAPPA